jgi:predicted P-loop ATPase
MGAVARVFEPGCKFDYTLVLEGDQGTYKSTLLRTLAGDWFTDQIADFGSKDASLQLHGVWIIELSELDALNRSEIARMKAFLTQQTERFRVPYGRRLVSVPRQCIFAGTTNSQTWMKDETGGRRFVPVSVVPSTSPPSKGTEINFGQRR